MHKTKKKAIRIAIIILVVVSAILVGGAEYLLSYSLNPSGRTEREAGSMDFLRSNHPGTAEWMDSLRAVGILRDTFIVNDRGIRLHALYAACDSAQGTAILVHGYTDDATRMMQYGRLYRDSLHCNILAMDHQRHGKSEGDRIQMGWLDRLNVERWVCIADSMWHDTPIYLHGVSMGAATVMMCSGDALPASVKCIIEDCGYTSVWDEFSGEISNQFHLPVHPLMDIASALCQWHYGWNFKEASALNQVRRSTLPMLFIHGDADDFVPTAMVYPLYEAKTKGYKQLWIAPGTGHALAYHDYPEEYYNQLKTFLAKVNEK